MLLCVGVLGSWKLQHSVEREQTTNESIDIRPLIDAEEVAANMYETDVQLERRSILTLSELLKSLLDFFCFMRNTKQSS